MSADNKITKTLDDLRRENYSQVSISELAHRLGMPAREVTTHLRTIRAKTVIVRGEKYVMLDDTPRLAQRVHFSNLPKPKSPILREVE